MFMTMALWGVESGARFGADPMPNSFDTDPRGPSNLRVFVLGVVFVVVAVATATLMVAKSQGKLDDLVRIDVRLSNIGDGLPPRSDVKYHELLVGSVDDITPSTHGLPNEVHVVLKPEHAAKIPNTVTARVVPANLFAVSAINWWTTAPPTTTCARGRWSSKTSRCPPCCSRTC